MWQQGARQAAPKLSCVIGIETFGARPECRAKRRKIAARKEINRLLTLLSARNLVQSCEVVAASRNSNRGILAEILGRAGSGSVRLAPHSAYTSQARGVREQGKAYRTLDATPL